MLLNRHSLGPQTWPVGLFLFPRIPLDRDSFVGSVFAEAATFFPLSLSSKCYPLVLFICPTLFTSLSALCVGSFPDDFNTKTDCYSAGCCLLKPFLPWLCHQALAGPLAYVLEYSRLTRVWSFGYSSPLGHSLALIPLWKLPVCVIWEVVSFFYSFFLKLVSVRLVLVLQLWAVLRDLLPRFFTSSFFYTSESCIKSTKWDM